MDRNYYYKLQLIVRTEAQRVESVTLVLCYFYCYVLYIVQKTRCKHMYQSVPQKWSVRLSPSVMEIMSFPYMHNEG